MHILIKFSKIKDKQRISKGAREKRYRHTKDYSKGLWTYFLEETLHGRKEWNDIFKLLKGKKNLPVKSTLYRELVH